MRIVPGDGRSLTTRIDQEPPGSGGPEGDATGRKSPLDVPSPAGRGWPEGPGKGRRGAEGMSDAQGPSSLMTSILLPRGCCVEDTRDESDERPSPLAGEGGPEGRMRGRKCRTAAGIPGRSGGLSNPDEPRASRPPHLTPSASVFPREGGRPSSTPIGMLSTEYLKGRRMLGVGRHGDRETVMLSELRRPSPAVARHPLPAGEGTTPGGSISCQTASPPAPPSPPGTSRRSAAGSGEIASGMKSKTTIKPKFHSIAKSYPTNTCALIQGSRLPPKEANLGRG